MCIRDSSYIAQAIGNTGEIYALEKDEKCLKEARSTFFEKEMCKYDCVIHLLPGPALESLQEIESQGPFDLVFIDANKAGYLDYYYWAKKNLRPGGYLVADNVFLFGSVFQDSPNSEKQRKMWDVMNRFLKEIFEDSEFQSSLVPTQEGMVFAVKKPVEPAP